MRSVNLTPKIDKTADSTHDAETNFDEKPARVKTSAYHRVNATG